MVRKINFIWLIAFCGWSLWAEEYVFDQQTDALVARLDIDQWYNDVDHLATYNRYYRNPGVHEARDWLVAQFQDLGFTTHLEEFSIRGVKAYNVVAEKIGNSRPDDIYLIGAHYDSISEQPNVLAPGAEDNASGTAGLLALARMLTSDPEATIRFIAFSGEEAGLFGSKAYVAALAERDEKSKVKGVYIMDMIGFTTDDKLDVIIETSEANQPLVDLSLASFNNYSHGSVESTFNYWGSDHVPFIDAGIPTVLLIDGEYASYPAYHRSDDVIANITKAMGAQILKMIGGAIGYWLYSAQ